MHLKIILKKNKDVLSYKTDNIPILYNSEDVLIQGSNIIHNWKNDLNETFYVSGYIIGQRSSTEKLIPIKISNFRKPRFIRSS